jgi:hypothetical protein
MTCYLRLHEVFAGLTRDPADVEWTKAFKTWHEATTVADRENVLTSIGLEAVDVYDLPTTDLSKYRVFLVSDRVDQEFLYENRSVVENYLDHGGVLVVSGELFRPWLPGAKDFQIKDPQTVDVVRFDQPEHPMLNGFTPADLGPGFVYGSHAAPEGTETLVTAPDGRAALYVDRETTNGTVMLHAGHTLLGFLTGDGPAQRMVPQMMRWMGAEASK